MQTHPDRVVELIRAALLREPGSRDWTGLRRDFGIIDHVAPDRSLPEGGPMLAFFMLEPDVALGTLIGIVEHATAGWTKSDMANVDDEGINAPFEILVDGQWVELAGNANVMHWHRGDTRVPQPLACALMGLEQFLYQKLDADEDIQDILSVLLTSRSVAIFGVLVETACYHPELLRGTLAPLATSAALILADRLYKRRDHPYLRMAFTSGEQRRLKAWHNMPHRLKTLDGEIMRLAVAEGVLVADLASAREIWAKAPDNRWRFLVAQMDPANYTPVKLESGAQTWTFEMPAELQREIDGDQAELQARQWWLTAPSQLADLVQARTQAADNDAQNLWDQVQQHLTEPIPADIFDDGVLRRADVECGTAAALLVCAPQWVDERPEVTAFCREALIKPFKDPPPTHMFDSGDEIVDWSWDGFAATAIPLLWQRDPQDTELRQCASRLATHLHRDTVRRFFLALEQLPTLNYDLRRLELLSLHMARYSSWAHERRHREDSAQYWPKDSPRVEDLPDVETPTREAFEAFVSGSLSINVPSLERFISETPAGLVSQHAKPISRIVSSVDMSYLLAARAHLLSLPDGLDDEERGRRLDLAAQFSSLFAKTHAPGDRSRVPSEEERTLNTMLAAMTVRAEPGLARRIWEPILATGSSAHYWVSDFINDVWRAALAEELVPADFSLRVKEMMAFAAEQETWTGSRTDELELALLCLSRFGHPRMVERHRQLLTELQPEWTELAARQMVNSYSADYIVDFLADPVAADIVAIGLEWLAERERQCARPDDALDKSTAELLAKLRGNDPQVFYKQTAAADVLAALVARQNPIALQLSAQLGRND